MRAIDLYSGVGGWSLGLRLAGIDVVASYEWWPAAVETYNANLGAAIEPTDIRKLVLARLPKNIDLVVGSPPCTQFSYANRGGDGDLEDGFKDLVQFFRVVAHLKPRYWAMENVPRVASLLQQASSDEAHPLYKFRRYFKIVKVVDFSDYGAPQARRRCIAGNIPFELIDEYAKQLSTRTLGDVVQALSSDGSVVDPVWSVIIDRGSLTDSAPEPSLSEEEVRMNRIAKSYHPVYNDMAFPDRLDRPARTVTATCTRVSRESIIIPSRVGGGLRRLTVRERASLQGFPITYQFFGRSFAEKAKLVGNAIPPSYTFLVGLAVGGLPSAGLASKFASVAKLLTLPARLPVETRSEKVGSVFPEGRSFRAALPGLRFKSGVRLELQNAYDGDRATWEVSFYFGSSKDIRRLVPDAQTLVRLRNSKWLLGPLASMTRDFDAVARSLSRHDPLRLQEAWTRRIVGPMPFEVVDALGDLAEKLDRLLVAARTSRTKPDELLLSIVDKAHPDGRWTGREKLGLHAVRIISGVVVAAWFNSLDWHLPKELAAA